MASSDGISSWTPLKPQHSIPCWLSVQREPSACRSCQCCQKRDHQKFVGGFALSGLLGSGRASTLPLGTVSWFLGHSTRSNFHRMAFFPSLKHNFIAYHSSKVQIAFGLHLHFGIHQLWQSGFSRVYSNSSCNCSLEPKIIKIGQSSLWWPIFMIKMYSNKILNFQESTTILNACTKKSGNLLKAPRITHT